MTSVCCATLSPAASCAPMGLLAVNTFQRCTAESNAVSQVTVSIRPSRRPALASRSPRTPGSAAWNSSAGGSVRVTPETAACKALMTNTMNSTVSIGPGVTTTTRPPGLVTRTSSARPRAMSGNSETPFTETATSKASSFRSRACPSMTRPHSVDSPSARARAFRRSIIAGARSVATTSAPSLPAGMLSPPLPAATSSSREPGRSPRRRTTSFPSTMFTGVTNSSNPCAMHSMRHECARCSPRAVWSSRPPLPGGHHVAWLYDSETRVEQPGPEHFGRTVHTGRAPRMGNSV